MARKNFWNIVNSVIEKSDIVLIVLDARLPIATKNSELESKIKNQEKKYLFVINKCDLVNKSEVEKIKKKIKPSVFVSGKKHYGTNILRRKIMAISGGEKVTVGVLGYPNVGKSSVINMLKGRGSAAVSPISGYTKSEQKIKASNKIILLDTPGVIPFFDHDHYKKVLIGTINFDKDKDPEGTVLLLLEELGELISSFYEIKDYEDSDDLLEKIAIKRNKLKKGGTPDIHTVARAILKDWQHGKIHYS